jgi:hypothetical protein
MCPGWLLVPPDWDPMIAIASRAEMRERQRVRVALFKGEPVPGDEYQTVRKVLDQVRWYAPLALFCGATCCLWLYFLVIGHGTLRWGAILYVFAMGLLTLTLLRTLRPD